MIFLPPQVKVFYYRKPTDMRKSFDTLGHLIKSELGLEPLSGHLFLFRNRTGDRLKVMWWDHNGYCLFYKRLEKGRFPLLGRDGKIEINPTLLGWLISGNNNLKRRRQAA